MTGHRIAVSAAAAVLAIGCGACGSGGDDRTTPASSAAAANATTQSAAPTLTAATVDELDATPQATTPLARAQAASIDIAGGPDRLVPLGGFVWVKADDGTVLKVDPATNLVVADVQADTKSEQYCQGLGATGDAIWSCSGSDVVRIDPTTVKVAASIPVAKIFDQGQLVVAADRVWVLTGNGDQLVGIDAATGESGAPVQLPVPCNELGRGVDGLWAICRLANAVLRIDPVAGMVKGRLNLEAPTAAADSGPVLRVGYTGGLARVDTATLQPVGHFPGLNPDLLGDLAVDGDEVWVRTEAGFLYRIDATSNAVVEQIASSEPLSGGSVLVLPDAVWTTANDDNVLLHLGRGP